MSGRRGLGRRGCRAGGGRQAGGGVGPEGASGRRTSRPACQLPSAAYDAVEHGYGEPAGKRVLLARVVRANDRLAVSGGHLHSMTESRTSPYSQHTATHLVGKPSQGQQNLYAGQQLELAFEEGPAGVAFLRRRPVLRRGALYAGRHPDADGAKAVIPGHALGLVRQAGSPKRGPDPIARTVTREDPPRPVAAVSGRR